MLPTMAALPLMAALWRAQAVPPQAMVLLHFAAMFVPALLLRQLAGPLRPRALATACALCLAAGAAFAWWAPPPVDLFGLAIAQGTAWGLAWSGQLWVPERRGNAGASPLSAAIGYAALTLFIGIVIASTGATGMTLLHVALGALAAAAWLVAPLLPPRAVNRYS